MNEFVITTRYGSRTAAGGGGGVSGGGSAAGVDTFSKYFEIVNEGTTDEFIKAKFSLHSVNDIVAFSDGTGGGTAPSIPIATYATTGVVKVDPSTMTVDAAGMIAVKGDLFNLSNYYDKAASDGRFSAIGHKHLFSELDGKPTTLGGYGITDAMTASQINTAIAQAKADIVNSSPAALDTLNELATALGNDPNFATTTATALGNRLRVDIATQGLTDAQKANGRANLGLGNLSAGSAGSLKISTPTGYAEIGSMNDYWFYFVTDRPDFYMNKSLAVNGEVRVYDTLTYLNGSYGAIAGNTIIHAGNIYSYANKWYDWWVDAPGYDANTIGASKSGFSYSNNCPNTGCLVHFDAGGYGLQLSSVYHSNGNNISFRTRNGDVNTWNSWYNIFHDGNLNKPDVDFTAKRFINKLYGTNELNSKNHLTQFNRGDLSIATGWIAAAFGDNLGNRVVVGQASGKAIIGGYNGDLTEWADLIIKTSSRETVYETNGAWDMPNLVKLKSVGVKAYDGTVKWTAQVSAAGDYLEFYNASGVLEMRLSQAGKIQVRDDVEAFSDFS